MRKLLIILLIIFILAVFFYFINKKKSIHKEFTPEIINISESEVTIAWFSEEMYKGKIYFKPTASNESYLSVSEVSGGSKYHEINISGLTPATRYTYRIGNSEKKYQFQTIPLFSNTFSFLLVWGDVSGKILSLMMTEMPEFIVSLTSNPDKSSDWFKDIRPFIPIYEMYGLDSPFLETIGEIEKKNLWFLDWGGLRLIFLNEEKDFRDFLESSNAHTTGIITTEMVIDLADLNSNKLQQEILTHNKNYPLKKIEFVLISGNKEQVIEDQGIHFIELPANKIETSDYGCIRFDLDVESSSAIFLNKDKEIVLNKTEIKKKLTCDECRRLADKGAYEKSIKAYQEFIAQNENSYQIDDAYFAIATIFDEKLFQFDEALSWYQKLLDKYPDGSLNPIARQRIEYISAYSEYDFIPFTKFEKIRKIDFVRCKNNKKVNLLKQLEKLATEFPKSKIAPEIQFWIANQYRQLDPKKAIKEYLELRDQFPESQNSKEIFINIGKTFYDTGNFKEALKNYRIALGELPELEETIDAQINRCKRNIRRIHISYLSWILIIFITALSLLKKPIGADKTIVKKALVIFIFFVIVLLFGAWLIKEQFSSRNEMLLFVFIYSFLVSLSSLISNTLAKKSSNINWKIMLILGILTGLIFISLCTYLLTYYLNIHYLVIIGL